jgi:hypothetical protein
MSGYSQADSQVDFLKSVQETVRAADPVLALLNEVFAGTALYSEKLELWSIAKDIARSLAYGDITEVEARSMVAEVAAVTAARLQSEGKSISPDVLAERLFEAVKEASVKSVAELRARMFERIVKSRMRARERRETLGIL